MIVTIDGPAGAGKSTAARGLARRLGFDYLDTGAMYRAVTLAALRLGLDVAEVDSAQKLLGNLRLEMPAGRVLLNGEDVTEAIRTQEVTAASGAAASSAVVRAHLAELQREIARGRDIVCEGRDQGTVVFPDAACKFYLIADPEERARRRQREMAHRGETIELAALRQAQEERDRRDANRAVGPMTPAADAIWVDSTGLTAEQVVETMAEHVRVRRQKDR